MKKIFLFLFFTQSIHCFALSDAEYKAEFQRNFYQSCYKDMTSGTDRVDNKTAYKACGCMAEKTVSSMSVFELKKYDKNPLAYKDFLVKIISQCFL